ARGDDGPRILVVRIPVPDVVLHLRGAAADRHGPGGHCPRLRSRRLRPGGRRDGAYPDRPRPPVHPHPPPGTIRGARGDRIRAGGTGSGTPGGRVMELILALGIGVLAGSGVWLLLRPRTYPVIIGLSLISYAVNLFIFGTGRLRIGQPPILTPGTAGDPTQYADPVPQALVLTAIVIGFATTALFLVVLLAARGLTGSDHVDGREQEKS